MKLTAIATAITLGFASQTFAHGPTTTPDLVVRISGSSAEQKILGQTVISLMVAGTVDQYTNNGTDRAFFGTMTAGTSPPSLAGKKVLVYSTTRGGSWWGVAPVARAVPISFMTVNNTCTLADVWFCPNVANAVPDAGGSDLEPGRFVGINVAAADSSLTNSELANLFVQCQFALVYGVGTSKAGLAGLSRTQIGSLLTGNLTDWGSIPGAASGPVTICRRKGGSGIQAAYNRYFQDYGCCTSAIIPADASNSIPGQYEVIENDSSGAVEICLKADPSAIGVLSLETTPTPGWSFLSIDGVAPSVLNAVNGLYDFYYEGTFQWRNGTVNGVPAPTGTKLDFLQLYLDRSTQPSILSALPGFAALPLLYDPANFPPGQVMRGTRQCDSCAPAQLFY